MVVPRSVFQFEAAYLNHHKPWKHREIECFSCRRVLQETEWVFSNYNGLHLVRRHLVCAIRTGVISLSQAKKLNASVPTLKELQEIGYLEPMFSEEEFNALLKEMQDIKNKQLREQLVTL